MNEGEWGKGEREGGKEEENRLPQRTLSGKTLPAEAVVDNNGKVPLQAYRAGTGAPPTPQPPVITPPSPRSREAAGAEWPIPGGS